MDVANACIDASFWKSKEIQAKLKAKNWKVEIQKSKTAHPKIYLPSCNLTLYLGAQPENICENHAILNLEISNEINVHDHLKPVEMKIKSADDIVLYLESAEFVSSLRPALPPFQTQLKYMTWRSEGLPREYIDAICCKHDNLLEFLESINLTLPAPHCDELYTAAIAEIKQFLENDYEIE